MDTTSPVASPSAPGQGLPNPSTPKVPQSPVNAALVPHLLQHFTGSVVLEKGKGSADVQILPGTKFLNMDGHCFAVASTSMSVILPDEVFRDKKGREWW